MNPLHLSSGDSVLAVVAHPDDMEYGVSAAVAKWVEDGVRVDYLLLTRGEHGIAGADPATTARVREAEQQRACDLVGAHSLEILDFPDGTLTYSLELRAAIARVIRTRTPSVVLTQNFDVLAPWGLNQADHRVAGVATLDAARDAGNEFIFPGVGAHPHQPRLLLISGHGEPDCGVVIEQRHVDQGAASLDAHEAYFQALTDHPSGDELVSSLATQGGEAMGTRYAILFKAYQL